ncbi:MAG: penicillin-binding protein 2 [Actinobacteria bacterium]|nr:penicillin-binding protein 2 [Actinomycetota bacterium]
MNRQIRRLGVAVLVLFTALFAQVNYLQVFHAKALTDDPRNTRRIIQTFSRPRGTIVSADGTVLARSKPSGDEFKYRREYPEKNLFGFVTGYFNFNFGATGVESSYNEELAGDVPALRLSRLRDLFVNEVNVGNVRLTIRKDVQQVAAAALGANKGSVVALDPRTGAVLAFWSNPSYDPNLLSSNDSAAGQRKLLLDKSPDHPLLPKMYREVFPPGSTFKVVTSSVGLQTGKVTPAAPVYPQGTSFNIDFTNRDLANFGGERCGGALFEILRVSCNSAFAAMGSQTIGPPLMVQGAESFGFNSKPPIDLPAAASSRFPTSFPANQGNGPIARASIGQGDVVATPLQMAMVAAAVANKGQMMVPHVLDRITDKNGKVIRTYQPKVWKTPLAPPNAETMRQAMLGVAASGTATRLQIPGYEVGGKTGTAQIGSDRSHAWIIGFAGPPGDARVAVAVIIENQPGASEFTGGRIAAPVGQQVMAKVLQDMAAAGQLGTGSTPPGTTPGQPPTSAPATPPPTTPSVPATSQPPATVTTPTTPTSRP